MDPPWLATLGGLLRRDSRRDLLDLRSVLLDDRDADRQVVSVGRKPDLGAAIVAVLVLLDELERVEFAGGRLHALAAGRLIDIRRGSLAVGDRNGHGLARRRERKIPDEGKAILAL